MTSKFLSRNGEIYRILLEKEDTFWLISFENPMERSFCIAASELDSFQRVPMPQNFAPEEQNLSSAAQQRLALIQPLLDQGEDAINKACACPTQEWSFYVSLECDESAVLLCLVNAAQDRVEYCREHSIEFNANQWPASGFPHELITDKGTEFFGPRMQELCQIPSTFQTGWQGTG